jgi:hypothetical protein
MRRRNDRLRTTSAPLDVSPTIFILLDVREKETTAASDWLRRFSGRAKGRRQRRAKLRLLPLPLDLLTAAESVQWATSLSVIKESRGGRRMRVAAISSFSSFLCRLVKFGRNQKRRPRDARVIHAELVGGGKY